MTDAPLGGLIFLGFPAPLAGPVKAELQLVLQRGVQDTSHCVSQVGAAYTLELLLLRQGEARLD